MLTARVDEYHARITVAKWQGFAAKKRRNALAKRRAGLPFVVGVAFAGVDLTEARAVRASYDVRLPA